MKDGGTFGFMKLPIDVDKEITGYAVEEGGICIAIRAYSMSYAYLSVYRVFANFMGVIGKEAVIRMSKDR